MQEELLKHLLETCPHINTKVATDWIESVIIETRNDILNTGEKLSDKKLAERIEKNVRWHIRRINGFGGSDMSVIYTEYKGGFYPYDTSARDIVGQKLCLETPGMSTGDTERGRETEIFARRKFELKLKDLGLEVYEDGYRALDELNEKGGVPGHPWMKSSPDGIYRSLKTGEIILVDFKTPASQDVFDEMSISAPDYYKAQLAQYKYNLEAAGVKVDRVMLSPFSTKLWDVEINEFPITSELTKDVLAAGDQYWENVLSNELPQRPRSENYQYIAEMPKGFQEIAAKFILTKRIMSIVKAKDDKNKAQLLKFASVSGVDWNQPDTKTGIAGINISSKGKKTVDAKALNSARKEAAQEYEIAVQKYHQKLNELIESGTPLTKESLPDFPTMREVDEEEFVKMVDQVTVSVARGKKHPNAAFVEEMEAIGERAIGFAEEDMMDSNNFDISLDEIKKMISDPTSCFYKKDEALELFAEIGFKIDEESSATLAEQNTDDLDAVF